MSTADKQEPVVLSYVGKEDAKLLGAKRFLRISMYLLCGSVAIFLLPVAFFLLAAFRFVAIPLFVALSFVGVIFTVLGFVTGWRDASVRRRSLWLILLQFGVVALAVVIAIFEISAGRFGV